MKDVVVVGAGISGLATAAFLEGRGWHVRVLEAADHPGGHVRSDRVDGRVFDHAANGWLDSEPAMQRLLERIGRLQDVVPAGGSYGERFIWSGGRMHPVPTSPVAMARTSLLGRRAKARLLREPLIARGPAARGHGDESVGRFAERRLGPDVVDKLIGPMLAGIYAGDPYALSLRAVFPRMVELERTHRSLLLAMLRLRGGGAPAGHLQTLPGGAGALTDTLAERLGDRLWCDVAVRRISYDGAWKLETERGRVEADAVVLACPGHAQADLLAELDPPAAQALSAIPYAPVAVVAGAWPEAAWEREPRGFGVLAARGEAIDGVLGCVFTSCIFPSQARPGEVLLRVVLGGGIAPEVALLDEEALVTAARRALGTWFGEERSPPVALRVYRHPRGIPQYTLGHPGRVARARAAEERHPGLFLTGNHLQGIGVKDCAREAERTARAVTS